MTTTAQTVATKPTHRLYIVTGDGKNASWKEVAAAWQHRDGKGFNIVLDVLPIAGKLVMREAKDRAPKEQAQ